MKIIKYLLLLGIALPAIAAQKAYNRLARLQGHIQPATNKLAAASLAVNTTSAQEESTVDAETEKQIDDLIEQIAVPKNIAEYARDGNWTKVKDLAGKKDTDVNVHASHYFDFENKGSRTALTYAVMADRLDVVQVLVEKSNPYYWYTALMNAKKLGHVTIVNYLEGLVQPHIQSKL